MQLFRWVGIRDEIVEKVLLYSKICGEKPMVFNRAEYNEIFINKRDYSDVLDKEIRKKLERTDKIKAGTADANALIRFRVLIPDSLLSEDYIGRKLSSTEIEKVIFYCKLVRTNTLNKLEAMCSKVNSDVVDESVVFGFMHQIFCDFINIAFFYITQINENSTTRYYTNIIKLYNRWRIKIARINEKIRRHEIDLNENTEIDFELEKKLPFFERIRYNKK